MTTNKNNMTLEESFERSLGVTIYDETPIFRQGIAIVRSNGKFGAIMVGGKEIVPPIYDDLSDFEDGYAIAKWNGDERLVNLSGQICVSKDDKKIFLPEEYDWGFNFCGGICIVVKNGWYGILDSKLNLVIPCECEVVELITTGIFKFKQSDKWGIINSINANIVAAKYRSIIHEIDGFIKVELLIPNSSRNSRYGVLNRDGDIIVPVQSTKIIPIESQNNIFFISEIDGMSGVYDKVGTIIVPFIYYHIDTDGNYFYCRYNDINNIYNFYGEHLFYIDDKQSIIIPPEYEYAVYGGCGIILVSKKDLWGLINMSGEIIVTPQYAEIEAFDEGYAKVGLSLTEATQSNNDWMEKKLKYGLIDTTGEIVLPLEYEEIEKWDNGYYVIRKNGLYGLLSPSLHVVFEPNKNYLKKLDDKHILVQVDAVYSTYSLIDYFGNEIISADERFSEIEVMENGFLKVIFSRSQCIEEAFIGIFNSIGKRIYANTHCKDITYLRDGLLLIKGSVGCYDGYNIVNYQGKELFNRYFDSIEILENGDFMICENNCFGIAKNTGEIVVHPKYENKINFENGLAKIKIKGSSLEHKIGTDGHVLVLDSNKNEIKIPKEYYWGTDFINGVSIVRTITNAHSYRDCIGVIDEEGNTIIPAEYNQISLLLNNTLLVKQDDFYGLYDIYGNCILPTIFTLIEHLNKDRIRVVWNLGITESWISGIDTGKDRICNYSGDGPEWIVKNRSALCDARGNIISDKTLVYVGKFINGYARSYREVIINDKTYNVKFKKVGLIDINGNTILENDYDEIVLCNHSFAPIRIEKKIGIVDLNNKKIRFFEELNPKNVGKIDLFGRILYGDATKQYPTNSGVINFNGVIVPPGKYSQIELLDNGLIKVSNKEGTKHGILGPNGEEILKTEYSYISEFNNGFASICIGGTTECIDENFLGQYKHLRGKWGVIDNSGTIVVECIHNEEQTPQKEEISISDSIKTPENNSPAILCTDYIPRAISEEIDNDYYDDNSSNDYDDDTSSIYDNPYYNDNLDMDQQSIEFWNNL